MIEGRCVNIGPVLPIDVPTLFGWSDDEAAEPPWGALAARTHSRSLGTSII